MSANAKKKESADPESSADSSRRPPLSEKTKTELEKCAPNISLNIAPSRRRAEVYFCAAVAVLVQAAVVVVADLARRRNLKKGGEPVQGYAFPLTLGGTLVLCLGMFLCATVVEMGSKEKIWGVAAADGRRQKCLRILWLQRRHVVSDQRFEPYAIMARGPRSEILTSHPAHTTSLEDDEAGGRRRENSQSDGGDQTTTTPTAARLEILPAVLGRRMMASKTGRYLLTLSLARRFEVATLLGTTTSLAGYTLQFIGFRASHWSISISQLVATALMTVLRALIRRGLADRPKSVRLLYDHEMDWLATRIAGQCKAFWWHFSDGGRSGDSDQRTPPDGVAEYAAYEAACVWSAHGISADGNDNRTKGKWGRAALGANHPVVEIRQRLGRLSKWTGPATELAVAVATAVEVVMNTPKLLSEPPQESFTWSLGCDWSREGDNDQQQYREASMTVKFQQGQWKADATQIEAVLSLWLFHVREVEEARKKHGAEQQSDGQGIYAYEDWLRAGDAARSRSTIRLLCEDTPSARQNLEWWVGSLESSRIQAVDFQGNDQNDPNGEGVREFERHRVVGEDAIAGWTIPVPNTRTGGTPMQCCQSSTVAFRLRPYDTPRPALADDDSGERSAGHLAVISNTSLPLHFAQRIFTQFMWSISSDQDTKQLVGDTILQHLDPDLVEWQKFKLENSTLRSMVQGVQQAGLGTTEDAFASIVPALGANDKLPEAMAVLKLAGRQARHYHSLQKWDQVKEVNKWLFHKCKAFDSKSPVVVKATALLMETYGFANYTSGLWKIQLRPNRELEELKQELFAILEESDHEVVSAIGSVYYSERLEGWGQPTLNDLGVVPDDQEDPKPGFSRRCKFLKRHPAHLKVFQNFMYNLNRNDNVNALDLLERAPLHYAIAASDEVHFKTLLYLGADSKSATFIDRTPLHYASISGRESIGRSLLQSGVNIDAKDYYGMTPLHFASKGGHDGMVKLLLESGADVRTPDFSRRSALHWASYFGFGSAVELLLKAGAIQNAREDLGRTPLHLAALSGEVDAIPYLLKENADGNAKDNYGATACHLAARAGSESVILMLLNHGDHAIHPDLKDSTGRTPLSWAAEAGHAAVVQELLMLADVVDVNSQNEDGKAPLSYAAECGNADVVQRLLVRQEIDINYDDAPPLALAARKGHEAVVRELLKRQDIDVNQGTPLKFGGPRDPEKEDLRVLDAFHGLRAEQDGGEGEGFTGMKGFDQMRDMDIGMGGFHAGMTYGQLEGVASMLRGELDISVDFRKDFQSPLSLASENGHVGVVQALLEHPDVQVNQPSSSGLTPLAYAAMNGHKEVVRVLLGHPGIDVNSCDRENDTPLCLAASAGNVAVVETLLQSEHIDLNIKNTRQISPLLNAIENNRENVVRILVQHPGLAFNERDSDGDTPLSQAAYRGCTGIMRLLLDIEGIEIDPKSSDGHTPLMWAAAGGHLEAVRVLLERPEVDIDSRDSNGHTSLWWAREGDHHAVVELLEQRGASVD